MRACSNPGSLVLDPFCGSGTTGAVAIRHQRNFIGCELNPDYVKLAEAELRAEFEAEVKGLTMSQGKVLVKLIDRETGRSSYSLVKELRGGFNAVLWQGMAKLFGHDLKSRYDADGEDMMIEVIVQRIEKGELGVYRRPARTEKAQARLEKRKARLYRKYGLPERDITLN